MPERNGNGSFGAHDEQRDRPTGELVKQLSDQATRLVRQEVELAKAELAQKGKQAGVGAGLFGGAGLLGFFAFAALTTAAILALATALPGWAAALIVAAVYGAIAGVLALSGKKKTAAAGPPVPEQAIESTKEDLEWTKQRVRSARRP